MCGIVGAIAQRPVTEILIEGLKRLEYRGYDSAGVALLDAENNIQRVRALGKVAELEKKLIDSPQIGNIGISHTRWATHGEPAERNAHPHMSKNRVAVVHNGIIENYEELRADLISKGYEFESETDTEVIVHLIESNLVDGTNLFNAVKQSISQLKGAYALGVISSDNPDVLISAREGSPLLIGVGFGEHFISSDVQALLPVTSRFIYLENGDIATLTLKDVTIEDEAGNIVEREVRQSNACSLESELGEYRHYMLKEIYEQPQAVQKTLEDRLDIDSIKQCIMGENVAEVLKQVEEVQIIACGTSYHAGLIAKYWMESLTDIPCQVEVASEYRYRRQVPRKNMLFVTISQSGETADTLAALEKAKQDGCLASLSICNVAESSLQRESDFSLMTIAGPEIGVASTKAFTTQLVTLKILIGLLMQAKDGKTKAVASLVEDLKKLPVLIEQALEHDKAIEEMAEHFIEKNNALFLGRGDQYPVAMEGALKLKEISYIHAEAYPAGELKHGPLALVDSEMPIVAVAPNTSLLEKLKSNLEEVRSRGGVLYLFADKTSGITPQDNIQIIEMDEVPESIAPIIYTIPLQLLSYHVAVFKGTDVDKPRNLAKSVTVE
ncbi:glutamine--fructose-6-phosphate transaminase (isomerizing) [uncultured Cocleimonas sp.]|uniref:glutamine--fructose-6-phosphate transaminase (isomerizing) n=1 Tax=uncultured Cocleimonas sp. TaxID=1051587 RepID=UPI0026259C9A|nr:glutamine--fructose-6-phosphate transaminase (isomerizing) [uncultured Cocleimonas sp.]